MDLPVTIVLIVITSLIGLFAASTVVSELWKFVKEDPPVPAPVPIVIVTQVPVIDKACAPQQTKQTKNNPYKFAPKNVRNAYEITQNPDGHPIRTVRRAEATLSGYNDLQRVVKQAQKVLRYSNVRAIKQEGSNSN